MEILILTFKNMYRNVLKSKIVYGYLLLFKFYEVPKTPQIKEYIFLVILCHGGGGNKFIRHSKSIWN